VRLKQRAIYIIILLRTLKRYNMFTHYRKNTDLILRLIYYSDHRLSLKRERERDRSLKNIGSGTNYTAVHIIICTSAFRRTTHTEFV